MLKTRKKVATLAVASAIGGAAMMVSVPAHALNVSQNNVGQVLLFPYYTVKNGFDTVFTVTNTTNRTTAFKIRFREALNSRETRDFNVIMSPYDHWSAAVTSKATDGSALTGAVVRTFDKTCTSPDKPDWIASGAGFEVPLTNALFSGIYADGGTSAESRVQEGYFEVIEMGVSDANPAHSTNVIEYNAKHVSGVPRNCALVDAAFSPFDILDPEWAGFVINPLDNNLKGHVTYIDTTTGKAIDAEPTAIENFSTIAGSILAAPGDVTPNLSSGDLADNVNTISNGIPALTAFAGSQHGVSMALMARNVINEFATGSGATTNWVVTFPTKHHYTDSYSLTTGTNTSFAPLAPFTNRFNGTSCDTISMTLFDREEATEVQVDSTKFSPAPPSNTTVSLCYEANVMTFNQTNVFSSAAKLDVDTSAVGTAGWANLRFTSSNATTTGLQTFFGLPVIGFAAIMRDQGTASVNYGSSTAHTYIAQ